MQDRFKFRVWNKENKKLYDWDFLEKTKGENTFFWVMHQAQNNCKHNILMQCTGLKDKNGKLIYEGDVVNYDDRDLDPWHTPILNAVIEMRKYQWCMVYYRKDIINADTRKPAARKTWLGFDDFISSRIEVIGNIYENPELLED